MRQVTYVRTGSAVKINPTREVLVYGGQPWPIANVWSIGADAFKDLRAENPDVEFVEISK